MSGTDQYDREVRFEGMNPATRRLMEIEMGIRIYFNADCPGCSLKAARTARMDWLGRVELRTDVSPLGVVPKGEIVVVEKTNGRIFTGVYATRKVCLQVPLLFPYGLTLFVPPILKIAGRKKMGCNGDACEV